MSSIVFGKMMNTWGRKKILSFGILLIASTTLAYGLLSYVNDVDTFIAISLVGRFL
jgi:MFS family permease